MAKESLEGLNRKLSQRLQDLRASKGWRQDEAALHCGRLSTRVYAEIERGMGNPKLSTLWQIAQAYGVRVADLLA